MAGLASTFVLATAGPAAANVLPVGNWQLNEDRRTVAHEVSGRDEDGSLTGAAT